MTLQGVIAKSGDALLAADAVDSLRKELVPRATVLTPNLPEAACLLDQPVAQSTDEMISQGLALCELGAQAVLMKGGHGAEEICEDILVSGDEVRACFRAQRQHTKNTHGTGCTLSSAIAAGLSKGLTLPEAVQEAHEYLQGAIAQADALAVGHGHGPVHHFHAFWSA
jgi:hydroxymethylpyrimidine/phosphomethylpyrimidine kinase